jgi:hypothetical protein
MDNNQNNFENGGAPLYEQPAPFQNEITKPKNGFAIASLVLGIFGILCCCFWPVGGTCAILALVFTLISRKKNGGFNGLAVAGLVLSIIGLLFFAYMLFDTILMIASGTFMEEFWNAYYEALGGMEATFASLR